MRVGRRRGDVGHGMWTPLVVEGAGFGPPRTPPVEGKGRAV
jgi:hypothetical protein